MAAGGMKKNILLGVFSLLAACAGIEAALRLAGYNPAAEILEGRELVVRPSSVRELVYEFTPLASGHVWGTDVRINEFGFRDRSYSPVKPEETMRAVVLGDSVTFGFDIPLAATYPKRLEAMLAAQGRRSEVLSMAVGGYDTLQEVYYLEHVGLRFDPDVVVVGYCMNDAGVASVNLDYLEQIKRYGSPFFRLRLAQLIASRLGRLELQSHARRMNRSEVFADQYKDYIADVAGDASLDELIASMESAVEREEGFPRFLRWYTSRDRIGRIRFALDRLRAMADRHGFQVVVVILPILDAVHARVYDAAYAIVRHEVERQGFTVLELADPFETRGFDQLILDPLDYTHLNALGHRLTAEALAAMPVFTGSNRS